MNYKNYLHRLEYTASALSAVHVDRESPQQLQDYGHLIANELGNRIWGMRTMGGRTRMRMSISSVECARTYL